MNSSERRSMLRKLSTQKKKSWLLALSKEDFKNWSRESRKPKSSSKRVSLETTEKILKDTREVLCMIYLKKHLQWEWWSKTSVLQSVVIQLVSCSSTSLRVISTDIYPNFSTFSLVSPNKNFKLMMILMMISWTYSQDSTVKNTSWFHQETPRKTKRKKLNTEKQNSILLRKQIQITRRLCSLKNITRVKFYKSKVQIKLEAKFLVKTMDTKLLAWV